jgi:hypothetical protein
MSNIGAPHQVAPEAVRTPVGGLGEAFGQRLCRMCERSLRGRQEHVCSGRCRAAWSRRRKAEAAAERNRQVRVLLTEALRLLGSAAEGRG